MLNWKISDFADADKSDVFKIILFRHTFNTYHHLPTLNWTQGLKTFHAQLKWAWNKFCIKMLNAINCWHFYIYKQNKYNIWEF